jgi:hypothetical protein
MAGFEAEVAPGWACGKEYAPSAAGVPGASGRVLLLLLAAVRLGGSSAAAAAAAADAEGRRVFASEATTAR